MTDFYVVAVPRRNTFKAAARVQAPLQVGNVMHLFSLNSSLVIVEVEEGGSIGTLVKVAGLFDVDQMKSYLETYKVSWSVDRAAMART